MTECVVRYTCLSAGRSDSSQFLHLKCCIFVLLRCLVPDPIAEALAGGIKRRGAPERADFSALERSAAVTPLEVLSSGTKERRGQHGVGVSVTAFSQFRPPGEPKERRPRRPRRSSRTGGEFALGTARFSSPAVVLIEGAKNVTVAAAVAERPSRQPKRTADWGRTRPAFFSLSPPRFSCRGERRAAAEAVVAETSSGTGLILACRSLVFVFPFPRTEEVRSYIEPVALGQGCTGKAAQALDSPL
ncbi:hypothetical protein NDU88_003008 [Pleurodeles waltl]|uniref:Uncharacterized protein n=1 Tax=Pleurodeles waltl TaxID=8319 RepID=A0AAV7QDJ4_PLEWA|nr:hypothetical protein NDU88_003008 [Pleurodeles waltl]